MLTGANRIDVIQRTAVVNGEEEQMEEEEVEVGTQDENAEQVTRAVVGELGEGEEEEEQEEEDPLAGIRLGVSSQQQL